MTESKTARPQNVPGALGLTQALPGLSNPCLDPMMGGWIRCSNARVWDGMDTPPSLDSIWRWPMHDDDDGVNQFDSIHQA